MEPYLKCLTFCSRAWLANSLSRWLTFTESCFTAIDDGDDDVDDDDAAAAAVVFLLVLFIL